MDLLPLARFLWEHLEIASAVTFTHTGRYPGPHLGHVRAISGEEPMLATILNRTLQDLVHDDVLGLTDVFLAGRLARIEIDFGRSGIVFEDGYVPRGGHAALKAKKHFNIGADGKVFPCRLVQVGYTFESCTQTIQCDAES